MKLSRTLLIEDTSNDQGMKREHRSTILGALIAIACISIGLLIASVLFYRNKTYGTGPSCSKLTMSLVNVSLKFQTLILQIHCYFLLKKCENPLHCKGFSHFFNKK